MEGVQAGHNRDKLLSELHPQSLPGLREGEALPWRFGGPGLQLCFFPSCLLRKVAMLVRYTLSALCMNLSPLPNSNQGHPGAFGAVRAVCENREGVG